MKSNNKIINLEPESDIINMHKIISNENDPTELDMECCVCLNTFNYEFIIMNCCKKEIHKTCLMDWILSDYNKMSKCPLCIQNIENINNIISYEEFNSYIDILIQKEIYKHNTINLVYLRFQFEKYLEIVNKLYKIDNNSNTDSEIETFNDRLSLYCRIIFLFIYFSFVTLLIFVLHRYVFK
jgi:hypothetical protein